MKLAGVRAGMSRAAVGFAAAAEIQSRLPEGFTLQTGVTTQIMAEGAPQPGTSAADPTVVNSVDEASGQPITLLK